MNEFVSLLPSNATPAEVALEGAVSRAFDIEIPLHKLWHPQICPVEILPWLAWAFSVDEWNPDWPEATMRRVMAASFNVHLTKGTVGSVKRVLEAVGFPASRLTEWWQTPDDAALAAFHSTKPHTFSIGFDPQCNPAPFDPVLYQRLARLLAHTAPVRSHICLYLDVRSQTELGMAPAATVTQSHRATLCLDPPPMVARSELGLAPVATATQNYREVVCVETRAVSRKAELGIAPLSRPLGVIRLTLEV